ncbi:MAG: UDP-N-acetylglucosamine--N-acetylmuramyl-(pentapeptide) pyrophosphoryl-undecaprenol N-acetylglucosamine transferase [Candidatus Berkelbacteria bacterium]|nr:MAG: UDP-N-acetylglucosamine--N-acetylmuramyl-(pentapeptide) pyrophosphoryl-undecaprenol N-acetylglucosamine transferase [Candidatus Berkelbacteria bacterium]QQG51488.1 MAG: UDP-N-acetylglucosamine--N-acetylmuramyl-(pentapeptide) pyrophosphoryl-undecaprenol N-acetylglucosamine transferase [Candidatus Berkelbacteria bacterium]
MNLSKQPKPIILVGGGTGGHIFPLVAIGEELAAQSKPFVFVGEKGGREEAIVKELGWQFQPIAAGKMRRQLTLGTTLANLISAFRTIEGFFQALRLLIKTGATAVMSKGGYVALPMVYAAWVLRKPVFIHESDSVMGLTNRLSARFAARVFTAFAPEVYPNHDSRYLQVGIPIRKTLRQAARLRSPKKTRPLVLILGGIQGASAINSLIRQVVKKLVATADIVHVTGEREASIYQKLQDSLDKKDRAAYKPFSFLDRELAYYFQAADVVVSRAGSTTVAEGALFGKAMYLIPLPTAAGNHQVENAKTLKREHAVIMREEYQLSPDKLYENLSALLNDRAELSVLGMKLKGYFYNEDAIEMIIREIENGQKK